MSSVFLLVLAVLITVGMRVQSRSLVGWLRHRVGARERLLLIGITDASVSFARELFDKRRELAVEVVGFIHHDRTRIGETLVNSPILGALEDVPEVLRQHRVDRVVINLAGTRGRLPMDQLLDLRLRGVPVDHLASVYERYIGKIPLENLRPSWVIFSSGFRHTRTLAAAKRLLDISAAIFGLLLIAPLMMFVAAAVKLTSTGPAFYSQRRVGQNGRMFTIRKFRSMRVDAEKSTGAIWATPNDPRVTSIGRLLRTTRLDELPQLWNVLMGDMSLVGPRPERPEFVTDLEHEIRFYGHRHRVKPGLTGWAQISYPYGSSVHDALQKLQYDLYYLKHMSIALDVFIILATFKTVWSRSGC